MRTVTAAVAAAAIILTTTAALAANTNPAHNKNGYKPVATPTLSVRESTYQKGFRPSGYHYEPKLDRAAYDAPGEEPARGFCPNGYTAGTIKKNTKLAATNTRGWNTPTYTVPRKYLGCIQDRTKLKTSLPSWFPTNPTPDDLRRLGDTWGPDTPVAVALTVPMPDLDTCTPATLPTGYLTHISDYTPTTADWADGIEGSATTTWRFEGGSGLMYSGIRHIGHPVDSTNSQDAPPYYLNVSYYPALDPTTPLTIDVTSQVYSAGNVYNTNTKQSYDAWYVDWDASAGVVPDCGQAKLPQSLIRMWNIPRIAWENLNAIAPAQYGALIPRQLGEHNAKGSPTWPAEHWTSTPGTKDN